MKRHIYVIGTITEEMQARLEDNFEVHYAAEIADPVTFNVETGEKIEGILAYGGGKVPGSLIDDFENLKAISNYGVGYDGIDVETAVERGILVSHTPDVLNRDVANTTIMLMLAVSRRLPMLLDWVTSGKWEKQGEAPLTRSIEGVKVGILGLGRIGETIAEKLQAAFDCEIAYHSRNAKDVAYRYFDTPAALAEWADYLIAITPGGPATRHLVNREVMEALGPNGTLINVSRGSVVDQQALIETLQAGKLGAAGLDVFDGEPKVPAELLDMENVVCLPHVGSATVETRAAMGKLSIDNLISFFENGKMVTPVPECRQMNERA